MLQMLLVALALVMTALVATGCGKSSKTATTAAATTTASAPTPTPTTVAAGKPLSRSQWLAEGDAICARAKAKTSALSINSVPDFARVYPQIAVYNRAEAAELSKLAPPATMTHDWTRIVNNIKLHAKYVSEVAQHVRAKEEKAAGKPFHLAVVVLEEQLAIAKRDGFKQCSIARR
jgi:hypothetical protein